jgi:hypothetical protein
VRERRGTVGRLTGIAESVAAAARRRQRDRRPRILVYDDAGHPRPVRSDAPGYDEAVLAADRLVEVTGAAPRARRTREAGADEAADAAVAAGEATAGAAAEAATAAGGDDAADTPGRRRRP